jgi:hypothetical protein
MIDVTKEDRELVVTRVEALHALGRTQHAAVTGDSPSTRHYREHHETLLRFINQQTDVEAAVSADRDRIISAIYNSLKIVDVARHGRALIARDVVAAIVRGLEIEL